ncbi:MAG TPA: hypothetical protein VN957_24580 [Chthoniobacterales bacterium]|nr:hypothetical protein [Chthoniobacterales bacterium]
MRKNSELSVHIRGPGFRRTDKTRTDNQPETKEDSRTGPYTIRTLWSGDGKQLISAVSFRTKDQRGAQLTIVRELADGGKTLILGGTLKNSRRVANLEAPSGLEKASIVIDLKSRKRGILRQRKILGEARWINHDVDGIKLYFTAPIRSGSSRK